MMISKPPGCSSIKGVTSKTSPRTAIQQLSSEVCFFISSMEMRRSLPFAALASVAIVAQFFFFTRKSVRRCCVRASI